MAGLRCEVVRAALDDLLDDRLPSGRAARLSAHVVACGECAAQWRAVTELRQALRALPPEPLPEGFALRLHRRLVAAATAAPVPARSGWARLVTPVATAALGFLAAAALAAPLMTRPFAPTAGATAGAGGGTAAPLHAQIWQQGPAGDLRQAAVPRTAPAATFGAQPATAATGGSQAAGLSGALALTLAAVSPAQAVAGLSSAAAQAGGKISALPGGPADDGNGTAPAVATLDALIPPERAAAYVAGAAQYGTVLARAGALPIMGQGPPPADVHVLVTVLAAAATPTAATVPSAAAAAPTAPRPAAAGLPLWTADLLLRIARVAPWAGGAILLGLLAWLTAARVRRPPLP